MTRLLAFGDVHLSESAPYGPPGEFLREQEAVLERIVALAIEERVDAVLFAGDAFEKRRPSPAELLAFARPVELLEGIPLIAVSGNHDCIAADQPMALDLFDGGMLTLHRKPGLSRVGDVTVAALPWSPLSHLVAQAGGGDRDELFQVAAEHLVDVAAGLRAQIDGPAILLGHWSVSGSSLPSGLPVDQLREVVLPLPDLEHQGWEAIVLGHIHQPQMFSTEPGAWTAIYVGSPCPLSFGEAGEHGVVIIETPLGDGTSNARFVPIESRPFLTIDREAGDVMFNGFEGVDGAIVRLRYRCTREQSTRIDQRVLRQSLADAGAWHVQVEAEIVREARARARVGEGVSEQDAFDLFAASEGLDASVAAALRPMVQRYVEAAR